MDDTLSFASRDYCLLLLLIAFSRGMDFLSTWVATPNLVLEGNPLAKKLGWRWGIPLNVAICFAVAFEPLIALALSTTSLLVAARNFQSAWLMRSLGEEFYREWHVARIQETSITVYLLCLAGNTLLTGAVGAGLIYFGGQRWITVAIGLGILAYAAAVAFYTLLAFWQIRRSAPRVLRRTGPAQIQFANGIVSRTMEPKETDEIKAKS